MHELYFAKEYPFLHGFASKYFEAVETKVFPAKLPLTLEEVVDNIAIVFDVTDLVEADNWIKRRVTQPGHSIEVLVALHVHPGPNTPKESRLVCAVMDLVTKGLPSTEPEESTGEDTMPVVDEPTVDEVKPTVEEPSAEEVKPTVEEVKPIEPEVIEPHTVYSPIGLSDIKPGRWVQIRFPKLSLGEALVTDVIFRDGHSLRFDIMYRDVKTSTWETLTVDSSYVAALGPILKTPCGK